MANNKRKDQKKNDRKVRVRQQKIAESKLKLQAIRVDNRREQLFGETTRQHCRLECETFLAALGLEVTPAKIKEARNFLDFASDLERGEGNCLDDLFSLAHGLIPPRKAQEVAKIGIEQMVFRLTRDLLGFLRTFDKRAAALEASPMGRLIASFDDLNNRLVEACEARRSEFIAQNQAERAADKKLEQIVDKDLSGPDEGEMDEVSNFNTIVSVFTSMITSRFDGIQRWQLGIPMDFYRDIGDMMGEVNISAALFFLRKVYEIMVDNFGKICLEYEKNTDPNSRLPLLVILAKVEPNGYIHLHRVLKAAPELLLPDPEVLKRLKYLAGRINKLNGGESVCRIFDKLREKKWSDDIILVFLEQIGTGQAIFATALEIISSSEEAGILLLERCGEQPRFLSTYNVLRQSGCAPEQCIHFLLNYGDYSVGQTNISEMIHGQNRRREAVRLLVENALYFCCGEEAETMISLLDDVENGTKALRHYIAFATTEEPYKQLATLRYLKSCGTEALEMFVGNLRRHTDRWVGVLLRELDSQAMFSRMATDIEPEAVAEEHPLKKLASFDLMMRYGFATEVAELPAKIVEDLDAVLSALRGSRFEAVLLGQGHLRQQLVERLAHDASQVMDALNELSPDGNPYLCLRDVLSPLVAPAEPVAQTEVNSPLEFQRIVLISVGLNPEVVSFLSQEFGVPLHEIHVDARPAKFAAIRPGDIVVYDTTRTSHVAYYRAKHLAAKHGTMFRHATRTNQEALVEILRG